MPHRARRRPPDGDLAVPRRPGLHPRPPAGGARTCGMGVGGVLGRGLVQCGHGDAASRPVRRWDRAGWILPSLVGQDRPSWEPGSFQGRRLELVNPPGPRPDVALYVQTSRRDTQSWPSTNPYLQAVRASTVVETEVNATGGHTFALWQPGLQRGVAWLGRTVPGFMPKGWTSARGPWRRDEAIRLTPCPAPLKGPLEPPRPAPRPPRRAALTAGSASLVAARASAGRSAVAW